MGGRIRTVKPEWLEDERLADASSDARVLSLGLILLADDYGNGRGNVRHLGARVFPSKPEVAAEALAELEEIGFVHRYVVNSQTYFRVTNWTRHQRVDKPGKPLVPGPRDPGAEPAEPLTRAKTSVESNIPGNLANTRETLRNVRGSLAPDLDHDHDPDREIDHDHDQDRRSRARVPVRETTPTPPPAAVHRQAAPQAVRSPVPDSQPTSAEAELDAVLSRGAPPFHPGATTPPLPGLDPTPPSRTREASARADSGAAPAKSKRGPNASELLYLAAYQRGVSAGAGSPVSYLANYPVLRSLVEIAKAHTNGAKGTALEDAIEQIGRDYGAAVKGSQFHLGYPPSRCLMWLNSNRPAERAGGNREPDRSFQRPAAPVEYRAPTRKASP